MIVTYTQESTILKKDAGTSKADLIGLCNEKLRAEAYESVKGGRIRRSYRKCGEPLIKNSEPAGF